MMNALQLSQRLQREAGMDREKAEAFAQAVDDYVSDHYATKNDVELVRGDIRTAVGELKAHTWHVCMTVCGTVGVIQIGVIYGLVAKLVGGH